MENLQLTEIIRKMEHLSVLQLLSLGNISQTYVKRLANSLAYLEELHFAALDMALTFKQLMIPFCQNPKLKRVAFFTKELNYNNSRLDLVEINKLREPFGNDGQLTIYMNREDILRINFKIPDKSRVSIKPLSELQREVHAFDYY